MEQLNSFPRLGKELGGGDERWEEKEGVRVSGYRGWLLFSRGGGSAHQASVKLPPRTYFLAPEGAEGC